MSDLWRKYALTRIAAGDYMFASNDGAILWRVYSYEEDGSLEMGGRPVAGRFWAAAKFDGPIERAERLMRSDPDEILSWEHWHHWASPLSSRREAIEHALMAAL